MDDPAAQADRPRLLPRLAARARRRGRSGRPEQDPLGRGLWRRLHDDCATALRDAPERDELLTAVKALAVDAQRRWPTDSLDVPADAEGRVAYAHLSAVRRSLRESAYRARLVTAGEGGDQQQRLRRDALDAARALLDDRPR